MNAIELKKKRLIINFQKVLESDLETETKIETLKQYLDSIKDEIELLDFTENYLKEVLIELEKIA